MDKFNLRKMMTEKKRAMSENEIAEKSSAICERFLSSDYYKNAKVIYIYVSYNQEVVTDDIISRAFKDGKKVAVPKVFPSGNMAFCYINSLSELAPGYNGIMEPVYDDISYDDDVVMIVPGLAFDREYNRIGYGKGFYDKYLNHTDEKKKYLKVAFCYDFQIADKLEAEEHDAKMDVIITDSQIF